MSRQAKNFSSKDASGLKDGPTRDLLFKVCQYIERNPLLSYGFEFLEYTFSGAATNQEVSHGLGYKPSDVILTSKTGSASVTINYDLTTESSLFLTTSGATTVRLLVGKYRSE